MEKKINIYTSQFANGDYIPYTIGVLVSYLTQFDYIKKSCNFHKTFVNKKLLEDNINQCKNADILLCSCYVWNWNISKLLAEEVKKINPKCLIVFGGPQIPNNDNIFFEKHEYIDIIVHGEGEIILKNIFDHFFTDKDYSKIKGIQTKNFKNGLSLEKINIENLSSPYIDGTIERLVGNDLKNSIGMLETLRGCPFLCTFCDWGSLTYTKMRKFSIKRVKDELKFFSDKEISSFYIADSNFGIFKERYIEIAKILKNINEKRFKEGKESIKAIITGWAKIPFYKLVDIVYLMKDSLGQAVGISIQSMSDNVLKAIKRKNMVDVKKEGELDIISNTLKKSNKKGFIEIIIGLPEENLSEFKSNFQNLLIDKNVGSNGIYDIRAYGAQQLVNAELNDPEYVKKYKIKTLEIQQKSISINNRFKISENERLVVSSSSFNKKEFKEMILYYWIIKFMHLSGLTFDLSHFLNDNNIIEIWKFYDDINDFCEKIKNNFIHKEYHLAKEFINVGSSGGDWEDCDYVYETKDNENEWTFADFSEIITKGTYDRLNKIKHQEMVIGKIKLIKFYEKKYNFKLDIKFKNKYLNKMQLEGSDFSGDWFAHNG